MVGQSMPVPCYTPEIVKDLNLDSIKQAYCARMVLPKGQEEAFLLALMHYPELKGARIKCIQRRRFVPLTTMPSVRSTFFHKQTNRRYKILISTHSRHVIDSILLHKLPLNAAIGVLGHELAHVAYFTHQNFWGVMRVAKGNLSNKYLDSMEFATDQSTIDHGLGWQLLAWSEFTRDKLASKYFKNLPDWRTIDFENLPISLNERYMHPWTIRKKIKHHPLYATKAAPIE
jgi:hypothetical protein|nr:hypothetical protein [Cytophagaceae bacterium]